MRKAVNSNEEQACRLATENKVHFDITYHMYYHIT